MGRDFMVDLFYGFFLNDADTKRFDLFDDGFFHFMESLDEEEHEVRAILVAEGVNEEGDVDNYREAIACRESCTTMYVNHNNEVHRVSDLTANKMKREWNAVLERFCKERGFQFQKPDWWLTTEGQ